MPGPGGKHHRDPELAVRPLKALPNATLLRRELVEHDLARFWILPDQPLEPAGAGRPAFLPGQYVTLGAWADDGPPVLRPMTIASAPEHDGPLEFLLNRVRTPASPTPLSHRLFALPAGGRLFVRPAATGRFTLENTGAAGRPTKLLIAQDTGIAPFASMVRSRVHRGDTLSDLVLWHEAEHPAGLVYADEFRGLAQRGLDYQTWTEPGLQESVDRSLDRLAIMRGYPVTPEDAAVYVCGLSSMIRNVLEVLLARGFVPPQHRLRQVLEVDERPSIFFEQYDQKRLFNLTDPATAARLRRLFGQRPAEARASGNTKKP